MAEVEQRERAKAPVKGKALRSHAIGMRALGHYRDNTGWAREKKHSSTGRTYCKTPEDQLQYKKP